MEHIINININNIYNCPIDQEVDFSDFISIFCQDVDLNSIYIYNHDNNEGTSQPPLYNDTIIQKTQLKHLKSLKKYYKCKDDNLDCSICCDKIITNKEYIRELSCQHRFHKKCIDTWLIKSLTCPICRYNVI
jgi:hypothetical protein